MPMEEYQKAMKIGLRENKEAEAKGRKPGLLVLPQEPEQLAYRRESLGLKEIPAHLIAGTCTALRADAFSPNFSPVLPPDTEFAIKWTNLCKSHLEEGIRDPVKAVEYMNRYYIMEGHKRVSVLKYFGAVSVPGNVTRLVPFPSDAPEIQSYYEFLEFYRMTGQLCLVFRQPGLYARLMKAIGIEGNTEAWSVEESYAFRAFYHMFRAAFVKEFGEDADVSQAFLTYVEILGYQESIHKMPSEIGNDLVKLRQEIQSRLQQTESTLLLEDKVKKPLFSILRPTPPQIKVAFIHDSSTSRSRWVYNHEYGRYRMEQALQNQVETFSYEDMDTEEKAMEAIEDAIQKGAKMIFTTRSTLLMPSVKQAVNHPDIKILNCSLNTNYPSVRTYFPRLYGAKFIKGAIAGTLTQDGRIGYVTDYPTYGSIANINAFAQGARMVNANAKIYLEWSALQSGDGVERLHQQGIRYIDYRDRLGEYTDPTIGKIHNMALIQCKWGKMYQSIVRRVMNGSWKQENRENSAINYWWGMTQGVVNVQCSRRVSSGTRRLVNVLYEALRHEQLDPFYGTLVDQTGQIVWGDEVPRTAQQIMHMNWLSSLVEGRRPKLEEFTPKAQEMIQLQGLEGWGST